MTSFRFFSDVMVVLTRSRARSGYHSAYQLGRAARYAYDNRRTISNAVSHASRAARTAYNRMSNRSRSNSVASNAAAPVSHSGGAGGYYVNPPARVRNSRGWSKGYYGKKLRRIGRKRRRRRTGKVMRVLMHHLTTPQTVKSTIAYTSQGTQGQRTWMSLELAGEQFLRYLGTLRPSNFLYNTSAVSTATLQDFSANTWQLHLEKMFWDLRIQNRANSSMELKIYECVVRHDITNGAIDQGPTGWASIFQGDMDPPAVVGTNSLGPAQAALGGGPGKGTSAGVSHMWQHPAFTPFNSPQFCECFKITNTYVIKLGPNEITTKKFYLKRKFFKGRWLTAPQANEWQRGWAKMLLFSWVGMPVDDGSLSNQTKSKTDLFVQGDVTARFSFTPGVSKLSNFDFANKINNVTQNYWYNPAGMTALLPVDQTIQLSTNSGQDPTQAVQAP